MNYHKKQPITRRRIVISQEFDPSLFVKAHHIIIRQSNVNLLSFNKYRPKVFRRSKNLLHTASCHIESFKGKEMIDNTKSSNRKNEVDRNSNLLSSMVGPNLRRSAQNIQKKELNQEQKKHSLPTIQPIILRNNPYKLILGRQNSTKEVQNLETERFIKTNTNEIVQRKNIINAKNMNTN